MCGSSPKQATYPQRARVKERCSRSPPLCVPFAQVPRHRTAPQQRPAQPTSLSARTATERQRRCRGASSRGGGPPPSRRQRAEPRREGGRQRWGRGGEQGGGSGGRGDEATEGRCEEIWGALTSSSVGVPAPRISSSATVPCQCAVQPPERRPSESAAGPVHSRKREERLARRGGSRARHEVAAISRLYLAYTSPISRLSLGYLSAISRPSRGRGGRSLPCRPGGGGGGVA